MTSAARVDCIFAVLVEDNPLIAKNLAETLDEMTPVQIVKVAETQSDALTWIGENSNRWQLAIVDIFLKQGSGIRVVEQLRSRNPNQYVVVLSNYATPAVRKECLSLGANAVFDKSSEIDQLVDFCAQLYQR